MTERELFESIHRILATIQKEVNALIEEAKQQRAINKELIEFNKDLVRKSQND